MSPFLLKTPTEDNGLYRNRFNVLDQKIWSSKDFEIRGAREKTLLNNKKQKEWYLFKKPKYGKMEIYTEIFNSILANEMEITHVQYFPVIFNNREGVLCKSFLSEYGKEIFELTEMKTLICHYSGQSDLDEKKGRDVEILKQHNIQKIFNIMKKERYGDNVLRDFFKMIGFDVLIGHGDRHWCNYGFLKSKIKDDDIKFAPVYDTSSGYLTEIDNELKLKNKLSDLDDDKWYDEKARIKGLCKITVPGDFRSTHFDLLKYIVKDKTMKKYKDSVSWAFNRYAFKTVQAILKRFFPELTNLRKQVILKILEKRYNIGIKILKEGG